MSILYNDIKETIRKHQVDNNISDEVLLEYVHECLIDFERTIINKIKIKSIRDSNQLSLDFKKET